jgi:hypothetical protein
MESIAFLGTGLMGEPMSRRLVGAGFAVTVWNRTRAKADAVVAAGARWAETPAAAVAGAGVVVEAEAAEGAVEEEEEEEEEAEEEAEGAAVEAGAEEAEAAFRGTGPGMRSATHSSIQNPPRTGSSRLRTPSLLWPASSSALTAAQPGGGSAKSLRPGRRSLARPPAALPERAMRSTAPAPRARGSRTPQRR